MDIDTQELKLQAPLIQYVQKHYSKILPIERTSTNCVFVKCLWHQENTASLALFSNGTYKCFGCGESGDLITLVQKIENMGFQEACQLIGSNVGYEIILEPPNPHHEAYKNTMDAHVKRYWSNLQNDGEAMKYLILQRGLSKETIDYFKLGLTDIEEFKYRTDVGNISHKIVFPILEHKRNPKCVGMAYRTLTNEQPKYTNDPNLDGRDGQDTNLSGVFIKGNLLYGYPMAIEAIRKTNFVYLVEGYMDVISMHQAGIKNVVGSMGTSLTTTQIQQLRKATSNIVLLMDNDEAGKLSMIKVLPTLYQIGFNVAICSIQGVNDPADMCIKYQFDGGTIASLLRMYTKPAIEIAINECVSNYETIALNERTKALQKITPIIDSVENEGVRDMYKSLLYKRLDIK